MAKHKIPVKKLANDIYKNLKRLGVNPSYIEDIKQEIRCTYYELKRKKGEPPSSGYLYITAYQQCLWMLVGNRPKKKRKVLFIPVADFPEHAICDPNTPETVFETTEEYTRRQLLKDDLINHGIEPDGPWGLLMSLWWIGQSTKEIALTMAAANLRPRNEDYVRVKLRQAFLSIEKEYGITKRQMYKLRQQGLNR